MASPKVERQVDFVGRRSVRTPDYTGAIDYAPRWAKVVDGVRCRTWRFKEIDESLRDGALIQIQPAFRTPVQHVRSETTFCEVPLKGKLIFLSVDPQGNMFIDSFNSDADPTSYMMEIKKGWTMCWYAMSMQEEPAEVLEYEDPGFKTADLPTVDFGANNIDGHTIPESFWMTIKYLDQIRAKP